MEINMFYSLHLVSMSNVYTVIQDIHNSECKTERNATGLTVCYSFRLFYFVMCGDLNFVSSHSVVETGYNIVTDLVGLLRK